MTTQYKRHTVSLEHDTSTSTHTTTDFRYVLVCDIETTTDFSQQLRLSGYVLYDMDTNSVLERGLTTGHLDSSEVETLHAYATKNQLEVMTHSRFIVDRLYPLLARGTALVNHNIVFDLGGMATSWAGIGDTFYLKLCECVPSGDKVFVCDQHPPIAIRSLTFPKALIYVNSAETAYAPILDTMTLGRALLGPGDMSLSGMGKRFKCKIVKHIADEHGSTLDTAYLDYTCNDVQATLELFLAEIREYKRHGLQASIASIMSEASIGKAYLQQLRIPAFYHKHQELPDWLNPTAMSAYYGARSEVKIRLQPTEIAYCDFKSQYPTVNALLHLQELLLADYITVRHTTKAVQTFLERVTLDDLQRPEVWHRLRVLVKIKPEGDIVPNKFKTDDSVQGYAVCYTHAPEGWYTLSDIVASKLLTGRVPHLIDAISMIPTGRVPTDTLRLFNDDRYTIDLATQDFFTEVINLRTSVKHELAAAKQANDSDQIAYLDSLQLALKLLANSTSYGVLVETRYEKGVETAGRYYASPVAVHITGAARLLLAIAERLGMDNGLTYAMCDTDSMAYARPDTMSREEFYQRVDRIVNWFTPLSPYAANPDGSIPALFELEEVNFTGKERTPLYFLGVSCKRYTLYNRNDTGTYTIRKVSAHATGRYQFDRDLPIPDDIPVPCDRKMKVWHYLLWYRAVQAAEAGNIPVIPDEEWATNIARYQESISTPHKAHMYRYITGIRPYSFFTAFPVRIGATHRYIMPYSPTHADIRTAIAYCTGTMKQVTSPCYDTLKDRFTDFFTHSEHKAANGNQTGLLERRTLDVQQIASKTRTGKVIAPAPAPAPAPYDQIAGTLWAAGD